MDEQFDRAFSQIAAQPGVKGVLCADSLGLCIKESGFAASRSSGFVTAISTLAQKLADSDSIYVNPIVTIETDKTTVLIQQHDGIVTAIYKSE
eukprot:TRINITY_DN82_c0_g1_i1.p1 TRINITY_DN82_c0_g1~~TRINITY_DN82_c0_g1_i1.p1  ORF type:complete len:105 (-),score=32.73 TRINITY_DN82_c0_g1_i1:66-344(-)